MKDLEKGFFVKYIIATICLVSIFAISIAHSRYMDQKITDISKGYLSKMSLQNAEIISSEIRTGLQSLNVIARLLGGTEEFTTEKINGILHSEAQNSDFISLGVVLKDGSLIFTPIDQRDRAGKEAAATAGEQQNGAKLLLSVDWNYINQIMKGDSDLSGSPARMFNNKTVNIHAVPIYRGDIAGAFVAFFDDGFFKTLVLPRTLDQGGCSYIADRNGNIVFHSDSCEHNNAFAGVMQSLATGWSLEGKGGVKLRNDIENGQDGTIAYRQDNQELYISYVPMNIHNWYFVTLTDAAIAESQSKSIYDEIMPVFIYILIIIMTLCGYFIYLRNQMYKRLESRMHIESINDESYRMIMEQTDDIIFEYDTRDKTYFHTANFQKNFGYEPTKTGFLGSLEYDYVHPGDVLRFAELYEKMRQDRKMAEGDIRIINSEGEYLWTRIYMLGVFDRDGKLAKVIGKIVNIDEKKKELQQLKEMAVTDSATGVYNKQTTEELIKAFLSGEGKYGKHAMLMIDIDDFKGINDDHGHRVGDAVISAMGSELNHIFRATDIKGRIGGDEFMILMKDIEELDMIVSKAKAIGQSFREFELDGKKRIGFSCSIGIAIYDLDGSTYEELYEAADRALYNCKNEKKGTYAFCLETDGKFSSR